MSDISHKKVTFTLTYLNINPESPTEHAVLQLFTIKPNNEPSSTYKNPFIRLKSVIRCRNWWNVQVERISRPPQQNPQINLIMPGTIQFPFPQMQQPKEKRRC